MIYNDILLETLDGDIQFVNGDFATGDSANQNTFDIINDNAGEWKQYPNLGVGIDQYINGSDISILSQNVKIQLKSDGFSVGLVNITFDQSTNKMNINPNNVR